MKKAKFKTKSPALAKLEKMCAKDQQTIEDFFKTVTDFSCVMQEWNPKRRRWQTRKEAETDQQSFAA